MKVITISREFGSGGRELGKRLADELGFAYYDKEITSQIAEELALDEQYVDHMLSKGIPHSFGITYASSFGYPTYVQQDTTKLLLTQQKILKKVALEGNCVIVGQSVNAILEDIHSFDIFVYASTFSKVQRCLDRALPEEHLNEAKVKKMLKEIDKSRAKQHELHSDTKWGDKAGYHLCINTTNIEIKKIVPLLANYINEWFKEHENYK